MGKLNLDIFIDKSNNIHNNEYCYSNVVYRGSKTKVKIICKKHGIFEQIPSEHLRGKGCPECGRTRIGAAQISNACDFITKSNLIHSNRYDYSLVIYRGSQTKVKIICKKHGIFEQIPNNHLYGSGCKKCAGRYMDNDLFIEKGLLVHGNKYDYSLVDYINSKTKVKIICKKHGIFEQTPNYHLSNCGCSKCGESKGENIISNYLNNNHITFVREKRFNNCRNILPLRFDFYLCDYNILIEYDGEQHFISSEFWGGNCALNSRKNNDNIKNEFAYKNGIRLVRIKYSDDINLVLCDLLYELTSK